MRRRQVRSAGKRDYLWMTAPLDLVEAPNTQDENTMVTASDWRAGDGFERATVLRIIIQGNVIIERAEGEGNENQAICRLAVGFGNGQVVVPTIMDLTTYNDFDLVAPWGCILQRESGGLANISANYTSPTVNVDITCRRRISVEDNVTLITRNTSTLDASGANIAWCLVTKVLIQRE